MKEKLFIDDGAQQFRDNGNIIINCGYRFWRDEQTQNYVGTNISNFPISPSLYLGDL